MKYPDKEMFNYVLNYFDELGIDLDEIAKQAVEHQKKYLPSLTLEDGHKRIYAILHKREVLNNLMTAIALDELANKGLLPEPLQSVVERDAGVYGVDEALAIANSIIAGSIAVTNYGFLDVKKSKVAKHLDDLQKSGKMITVFIDDQISALQAMVEGSLAHKKETSSFDEDTLY